MDGWKKVYVPFIFIIGFMIGGTVTADTTEALAPTNRRTVVTMKNSKGRVQRFSKADSSEIAAIFTTPINEANAFVIKTRHVSCKKVVQNIELQANYLIELPFIIETLNDSKFPVLSESHKETLSRVPLCEPYLLDLKIIALQLNGWKLEGKEGVSTLKKNKKNHTKNNS